jgi:hypothetical protein
VVLEAHGALPKTPAQTGGVEEGGTHEETLMPTAVAVAVAVEVETKPKMRTNKTMVVT